ncbi:MAG: tetratricopeptide repeat protein, partial [Chlorobium sp.]
MYDSTSDTSYDNVDSSVNTAFKRAEQGTMELNDLLATAGALSKDESIQLYRLWLEHTTSPYAFVACFNLGVALSSSNDYVAAEEMYRKALEFNPDLFQARLNLGSCLEQQSRVEEALEQWKVVANAINISKPENRSLQLHALNNLGRLLEITRQFQTAFEMLDKSFAIDPSQRDVLIHLVHLKQKICKWPIYTPPEGISNADMKKYTSPLAMLAISEDPALQLVSAKQFVEYKFPVTTTEILSPKYGYNHDKVRIGYLSSNLSMHAVSLLTVELFEQHNRSQFEVYGFCWSREDGTAFRKRVISAMDHFITIGGMDDREAAETIRFHEIDVLVDLHGLTSGARPLILAYRPAPIQVTYLGFPGPTGLPWIDYVIADRYLIPENTAQYFTEKPLYLPNCFQSSDSKREVGLMPTRVDNGLPEKAFVFCSFNNNYKFTQEVFATWMRILKRVPGSVFWLLADNEWSKENLLTEAIKQGINKERLVFAPRVTPADYLARYQLADLFLDTFPFNGGTTANDALFMGLPLLTLSGRTFASRMAGSLLTNLGLPELIATDLKEYEEK